MNRSAQRARGTLRWAWMIAGVACLALLLGVKRPDGLGDVEDVRTWSYPDYTRVVVEFDPQIDVGDFGIDESAVVRLSANEKAGRPERLYLDVPGIWVGRRYESGMDVGDGLLDGIRLGQNTLRNTRLVLDLERYGHHRIFTLESPPRIVVDVFGKRRRRTRRASGSPPGRLPAELRPVQTIVVDPGHGGRDPGALGVGGLAEKNVNLGIALELAKNLRERNFEVILTRADDSTLSLEERTALAESAGGDVFLSIHANASRRTRARGIEVYTLDSNHERHSLDVAARENGVPAARLDALQRALAQIQVGEVGSHSTRLAGLIHEQVMDAARRRDGAIPDLGVKKGPFYVLFMSSMSSVLVETGFVTNAQDAALLRRRDYRKSIAHRIAEGVDRYRLQMELGLASAHDGRRP